MSTESRKLPAKLNSPLNTTAPPRGGVFHSALIQFGYFYLFNLFVMQNYCRRVLSSKKKNAKNEKKAWSCSTSWKIPWEFWGMKWFYIYVNSQTNHSSLRNTL